MDKSSRGIKHSRERVKNSRDYQVFRYPGSKAKLADDPGYRSLLAKYLSYGIFYEAFAGSAAITLSLAIQHPDMAFHMCDRDSEISSFWRVISRGDSAEIKTLCDFVSIPPTVDMFYHYRSTPPSTEIECAYRSVFFNRTAFSGIALAAPIGGRSQESNYKIGCRYNSDELIAKIIRLSGLFKNRLSVANVSVLDWLHQIPHDAFLYLDPPYYVKGPRLYRASMSHAEHEALARILKDRRNWILSYDKCPEIIDLYSFARIDEREFKYSVAIEKADLNQPNARVRSGKRELIITPA